MASKQPLQTWGLGERREDPVRHSRSAAASHGAPSTTAARLPAALAAAAHGALCFLFLASSDASFCIILLFFIDYGICHCNNTIIVLIFPV